MNDCSREEKKQLMKEVLKEFFSEEMNRKVHRDDMKIAFKEWLSDMFAKFGRWTLKGIAIMAFAVVLYFWLEINRLIK